MTRYLTAFFICRFFIRGSGQALISNIAVLLSSSAVMYSYYRLKSAPIMPKGFLRPLSSVISSFFFFFNRTKQGPSHLSEGGYLVVLCCIICLMLKYFFGLSHEQILSKPWQRRCEEQSIFCLLQPERQGTYGTSYTALLPDAGGRFWL